MTFSPDSSLCKVDRDEHDCHSSPGPRDMSSSINQLHQGEHKDNRGDVCAQRQPPLHGLLQSQHPQSIYTVTDASTTSHLLSAVMSSQVSNTFPSRWTAFLSGTAEHQAASLSPCTNDHTGNGASIFSTHLQDVWEEISPELNISKCLYEWG